MIKITQNFYQANAKKAIHRWFATLCLTAALWLSAVGQVSAQSGSVTLSSPWAATQTLNAGTTNEFTIALGGGAGLSGKKTCGATTNTNVPSISSSNAHYLEGTVPSAGGATIEKITFSASNNATGTSLITNYVYYCTDATFNVNNVLGYTAFTYTGSDFACTPNAVTFPVGVKSFRIYRAAKVSGTAAPYVIGSSGTTLGSTSTFNFNNISVWVTPSVPTITLTSTAGTNVQTVPANSPIANIVYTLGGTATASGTNIDWGGNTPAGITFDNSASPVTISGTPTNQGTYNYTVTTNGSPGAVATGSITVNPADVTAPSLQSSTPANAAVDVALSGNITLAFDEIVTLADDSKITLTGGVGSLTTTGVADSTTLTIPYSGLAGATTYTLTIDSGAIKDMSGNAYTGTTLTFTTLTPAPVITLTSAPATANQSLKSGQAITPITYTFANANATTPYTLTGTLPTGVTAGYAAGVLTISGTATATVYPTTSSYTITATPLAGYIGSSVTASGSIVVRDPNAKNVAFLYTGTLPAGANKLYDMLNANYDVVAFNAPTVLEVQTIAAANSDYDLIVLHESLASSNVGALELGKWIGLKPILNTKVHMYGKANWPAGAGANGAAGDTFINVNPTFQAHPIFGGVTMTDGEVIMANTSGIIRYATGVTTASSNIATNKSGTLTNVSILEVNNQNVADAHKYMLVPFAAANEDLNANGLLLFKNACDYLMSSNVYFPTTIWEDSAWSNGTGPDSTLEAIIDDAYSTVANGGGFTAKKLTVTGSGSLTINSGTNVTVQNEVVNNGNLVVENNANLIQVNNVAINANVGAITVNRNSNALKRLDYTIWSSPVSGTQRLYDFSPLTSTSRFNVYNPVTNAYDVTSNGVPFLLGKGYLIRMPNENPSERGLTSAYYLGNEAIVYEGVFTGVPNNGDVTVTGLTPNGYNAIGNPYPSTVDVSLFLSGNTGGTTDGTLYFFRKTNGVANSNSSYATRTSLGGVIASNVAPNNEYPNGTIQVGQGFVVRPTGTTLGFTNTMRVANNDDQFFRTRNTDDKNRVWLNLTNTTGAFSQTLVGYVAGATTGVDAGIDGISINDAKVSLTSNINNEDYTIQGRSFPFDPSDVVPLNFKTDKEGDYTIAIDHTDGLFAAGQDIYLVDNVTGTETDLRAGGYTFTASEGVANARFSLKYQKTLGVDAPDFNENSVTIYKNKGLLSVNSGNATIANVKVYDVQGKLLVELKNVKSTLATISTLKEIQQVLIVKVTAQDGSVVTKKVIN